MGERQEGINISGVRFEADVAADRVTVSILDRKNGVRFSMLDMEGLSKLALAVDAAMRGMDGTGPFHADAIRFMADVSFSRTLADVRDLEGGRKNVFMLLSKTDLEELRELVYTLGETLAEAR